MSTSDESQSLDFLLAQVSRLHYHRAHELLGKLGLYRGQPPVLYALWEQDGRTLGELANRLGVTPATMTRMIQRMEKTGFVQRKPDVEDQRITRIYLTEAGRTIRKDLEDVWSRMDAESFADFSDEERIILRQFLGQIRDNLARAVDEAISV